MSAPFEQSQADETHADEAVDPASNGPVTAQWMVTVGPSPAQSADRTYLLALKRAGLLGALDDRELERILAMPGTRPEFARQLDRLELYYSAENDLARLSDRVRADRFVIHHAASEENAHAILRRVATVAPEIARLRFERIGTDDGPLVLRLGEHVCAVDEDDEDVKQSDEIDLSALEGAMVTVRSLVRAANLLLKRVGIERRFVLLRCDGRREAYCGLDANRAMELCAQGLLEERSASRLLEFGAW
jgi:hypothetical protein